MLRLCLICVLFVLLLLANLRVAFSTIDALDELQESERPSVAEGGGRTVADDDDVPLRKDVDDGEVAAGIVARRKGEATVEQDKNEGNDASVTSSTSEEAISGIAVEVNRMLSEGKLKPGSPIFPLKIFVDLTGVQFLCFFLCARPLYSS